MRDIFLDAMQDAQGWSDFTVRKLALEDVLRGHQGCVNRLAWNQTGTLLASASDDTDVRLWSYPRSSALPQSLVLPTLHDANIFGVQFLPFNDSMLVTGSWDGTVQLHTLDKGSSNSNDTQPFHSSRNVAGAGEELECIAPAHTVKFSCHHSRVKQVEVCPAEAHLFWSGSEDGTVRQFDTRLPFNSMRSPDSPNTLICASSAVKTLALNPVRPYQIAVGASEPSVRVYDRRMLSTGLYSSKNYEASVWNPKSREREGQIMKLQPFRAVLGDEENTHRHAEIHPTNVTFGHRGNILLATYHGDNAYCWSVVDGEEGSRNNNCCVRMDSGSRCRKRNGTASVQLSNTTTNSSNNDADDDDDDGTRQGSTGRFLSRESTPLAYWEPQLSASKYSPMHQIPENIPEIWWENLPVEAHEHCREGSISFDYGEFHRAVEHFTSAMRYAPNAHFLFVRRSQALTSRDWDGDKGAALLDAEHAVLLNPRSERAHAQWAHALCESGLLKSAHVAIIMCRRYFPQTDFLLRKMSNVQLCIEQQIKARQEGLSQEVHYEDEGYSAGQSPSDDADGSFSSRSEDICIEEEEEEDEDHRSLLEEGMEGYSGRIFSKLDRAYAAALEDAFGVSGAGNNPLNNSPTTAAGGGEQQPSLEFGVPLRRRPWLFGGIPGSNRFRQRFVGHCNMQTDIKEAQFLGHDDSLVACGSDDGRIFIYEASTGACIRTITADEDIVNCIQCHPSLPILATSGIESVVKIWSPEGPCGVSMENIDLLSRTNRDHIRLGDMCTGFDASFVSQIMEMRMLWGGGGAHAHRGRPEPNSDEEESEQDDVEERGRVDCRMS